MISILNEATGQVPDGYYATPYRERQDLPYDEATSQNPYRRNLVSTYVINDTKQLYEWAIQANPGDNLSVTGLSHATCISVKQDEGGNNIVVFYDPNNHKPIERDQKQLQADNKVPGGFNPLEKLNKATQVVICQHIVPGDKDVATSKIDITTTTLDKRLCEYLFGISVALSKDKILEISKKIY